ncbi:SDR family oxidoreductase [Larkinella terrae]|uniref:SDR family oxidoreductase n=1 Tax=Larkinella terrae TaxID=2025311 RepID=A0A7K0EIZ3_9BACT|nr:SDR family oxidoreductase [Larkinella terrae]MRS61418.1 SDR family oxidoreductase [Larkinella terrae]
MNLSLTGKTAIVCGSTQGIGYASAVELALLGANVTLLARNEEKLKTAVASLDTKLGQKHQYRVADFENPNDVKTVVDAYLAEFPEVHLLINNTGGPVGGPLIDAKLEEFTKTFAAHLLNNQLLAQAVVPSMKRAGYGRIVNIISTSVKQPIVGLGVSNTIRGAVAQWAKTLSLELAQFGITVNNVLPGYTKTARLDATLDNRAKAQQKSRAEIEAQMRAEIPMGRFVEPEEVGAAAAFLCTPAAAAINGINVPVDGGKTGGL